MAVAKKGLRNMTEGSCGKNILLFGMPMLLGSLLQQTYNLVDSWVVGNFVGDGALAAVGVAFPVVFLFNSIFQGISIGSTVVIAQFFGAGRMDRVKQSVETVYAVLIILVVPLTAVAVLTVEPLLHLLRIDPLAFEEAKIYMSIVCAGILGSAGYNTNSGILQGLGNSRTPLLFLCISTVLNIVLDLVTVIVLDMGVAGVAYATIIAQGVSWLFGIFYINRRYPEIHIRLLGGRIDRDLLKEIIRIGLPAGIQSATVSVGAMAVMGRVNTYGEVYTAAYNVGHKLDTMAFLPVQALSNAATAFVGQNMGANKPERVKEGTRVTLIMACIWCVVVNMALLPGRHLLVSLFSSTPAVVEAGARYMECLLPFYPFFAVMFCLNAIMRGAGESLVPMLIAGVGQLACRVPGVYLLAHFFGPDYMYYGFGIGWIFASGLASAYYASGRWKRHGSLAAKRT